MTIQYLMLTIAFSTLSLTGIAEGFADDITVKARLGYNLGGTAPVGLPASIRGINNYRLQTNPSLGLDAVKPVGNGWGVLLGIRFENKGMDEDARVKNYYEEIVRGGESLAGRFTGDVTTIVREWMFTVPLQASWDATKNLSLRFGPYVSVLTSKSFTGYAHSGYLRVGDPTGPMVTLGNSYETRGNYDFSDDMRHLQWGLDIGADYTLRNNWGIYADICWGLSAVHHSYFKTIEQTLYPIFGTFGFTYTFKHHRS